MGRRWVRVQGHPWGCHCEGCYAKGEQLAESLAEDAAYDIDERLAWGGEDVPS